MKTCLTRNSVLVLNKSWQAINVTTPADAISMMYAGTATGLHTENQEILSPLKWSDWEKLEYNDQHEYVNTSSKKIRIPTIIILCKFDKVPIIRPHFTFNNLWQRDKGICQYTGKPLTPNTGNIDHVIPRSRGGKSTWTNCVLCHREVNSMKADRTPAEAGLKLIATPKEPAMLPISVHIKNTHQIKEWKQFLVS